MKSCTECKHFLNEHLFTCDICQTGIHDRFMPINKKINWKTMLLWLWMVIAVIALFFAHRIDLNKADKVNPMDRIINEQDIQRKELILLSKETSELRNMMASRRRTK